MARMKQRDIGFHQGVIWAASYLVTAHGQATLAEYMLQEASADLSVADDYDLKVLAGVISELNRKK